MATVFVTRDNWFELWLIDQRADGAPVAMGLGAGDDPHQLDGVRLDELRALHFAFGAARAAAGRRGAGPSIISALDDLLTQSRALLRARATAARHDDAGGAPAATLAFPDLEHESLDESVSALEHLTPFLALQRSPSLAAWGHALVRRSDLTAAARVRPWLRVVMQKLALDEVPGVRQCLMDLYGESDSVRRAHLDEDGRVLDGAGLSALRAWATALGLDRPRRHVGPWPTAPRRAAADDDGPPMVTVLIPSFKHAAFITATVESVLAQTFGAFVVHVVDDASPDDTAARARAIDDPRVSVRVNAATRGLGDSVLAALDAVTTPYVALLNSDDLFAPERLARCVARLDASAPLQVVATGLVPVDRDGLAISTASVRPLFDGRHITHWLTWFAAHGHPDAGADLVAELLARNFLVTSSNIVCRTAFLRTLAPRLRGLQFCLDWQVFLDAAVAGVLAIDPEPLLAYRLHDTNTVWFDEQRAVAYRLEVNRVLARVLRDLRPADAGDVASVTRFMQAVGVQAARHTDARGLAMYAESVVDGDALEAARRHSAPAHEAARRLTDAPPQRDGTDDAAAAFAREVLGNLAAEEADVARGRMESLTHDLADRQAELDALARRLGALDAEQAVLKQTVADAKAELARAATAHAATLERAQTTAAAHLAAVTTDLAAVAADRDARLASAAAAHVAALEQAQTRAAADLAALAAAADARVAAAAAAHTSALERAQAQAFTDVHAAVAQARSTPEYLLGDRLWNRWGLSRVGALVVRALHTSRDLWNRGTLAARGRARRLRLARPGAVVAACWSFPIHSQTFVYQEMTALAWTGLDVRVFCCDVNPRSELPSAFAGLWRRRLVMQTDWNRGQRDLAHFRRTRPVRVADLLARLSRATGRTEESLLGESIVLTGFTFARHLELAGTRYVHTYFFYDQSFLGLMAAFLLEIPRGVTAYADHMLGDYPFKLVPLHLELADIVVATSARIKRELGAIGGGRFDDKIIVKPNGIDASRFPYIPPAERLATRGRPELVAVNRIEPKKGLIHLVEAVALLRDRGLEVVANIVGGVDSNTPTSAACHRELVARIEQLGLHDLVILHGVKQQHDFAPIAARSRLFVAPYVEVESGDKDGIPTAILEAMSTGLPIVATDAGSIVEAARHDHEAAIVAQGDAVALADAIARLLNDQEAYVRMAEAARDRAVHEFDIRATEVRLHERITRQLAATPA